MTEFRGWIHSAAAPLTHTVPTCVCCGGNISLQHTQLERLLPSSSVVSELSFPLRTFVDLIRKKLSDQCFPWILPGRGFHGKQRAALTFYALAHPAIQLPPCSFTCSHTKQAGLICLRIPEATWSASGHGCPARSISAPLMITESSLRLVPRTQRGNKRT